MGSEVDQLNPSSRFFSFAGTSVPLKSYSLCKVISEKFVNFTFTRLLFCHIFRVWHVPVKCAHLKMKSFAHLH